MVRFKGHCGKINISQQTPPKLNCGGGPKVNARGKTFIETVEGVSVLVFQTYNLHLLIHIKRFEILQIVDFLPPEPP